MLCEKGDKNTRENMKFSEFETKHKTEIFILTFRPTADFEVVICAVSINLPILCCGYMISAEFLRLRPIYKYHTFVHII